MESTAKITAIKGGSFLTVDASIENTFTPEDLSEEQAMVRESVREFVEKEVQKKGDKIENQTELMTIAAELGLVGAHIPEVYGGMAFDKNTVTVILEELGRGGGSFDTTFAAHTGIGMLPILYFGTEEQKKKYLPPMSRSEITASYCLTEPGSGSDALAAKTTAMPTEDGQAYLINGQKMWISNAGFADLFIVFAQVNKTAFTAFLVDRGSEGLTLGEEEEKMGIKGSSTRQVFFDNVKVPAENVLGEIGKGHKIAFHVLNIGRFKLANMCLGGSKYGLEHAVNYAKERVQFDQPISNFGAIKEKIALMVTRTFALESSVYRISGLLQQYSDTANSEGQSFEEALQGAAEEYAVECALIKVFGSETIDFIVDEWVQILGGNGYSEEYPAARSYRDARINRIYEGTNEINRLLSINMLMKRVMKGQLDMVNAAWEVQKELKRMPDMSKPGSLNEQARKAVNGFKKMTLMASGAAAKYQMDGKIDLRTAQEILIRVSDMLMLTMIAESMVVRYEKIKDQKSEDEIGLIEAILKLFMFNTQHQLPCLQSAFVFPLH
jgi:hypothetical protein